MNLAEIIEIVRGSIQEGNCILFLGPLFGKNRAGTKISEQASDFFKSQLINLDTEFQNLFIPVEKKATQTIASKVRAFYKTVIPGQTYTDVAGINFPLIISFTQDDFLAKEFAAKHYESFFSYYSRKGVTKRTSGSDLERQVPEAEKPKPGEHILYNLFGWFEDSNSIISSYDAFYDFLFSILGSSNFLPDYIRAKIGNAGLLLFLGFDLKKWYVPLLVAKILSISKSGTDAPVTVASINDSDTSNEAYMDWLRRYPLQFEQVDDSEEFLKELYDETIARKAGSLKNKKDGEAEISLTAGIPAEQKQEWRDAIPANDPEKIVLVFDRIIAYARMTKRPALEDEFTSLKRELNQAILNFNQGILSEDDFRTRVNQIVRRALHFLH